MDNTKKRPQCIVTAINEKYALYFSVLFKSIEDNIDEDERIEVIVLYNHLNPETRYTLNNAVCKGNIQLRFLNVTAKIEGRNFFVNGKNKKTYLSKEAYFRLLAPELLPEYKVALYLDSDIVVQPGWTRIFQIDLGEHLLAAVPDFWDNCKCYTKHSQLAKYRERELGITNHREYFNSGVMLLNLDAFRKTFKTGELLEIAASKNWKKHDQDVINMMCKGKVCLLDYKWNLIECPRKDAMMALSEEERNCMHESQKNQLIIHYASRKPWKVRGVQGEDAFWRYAVQTPYFESLFSLFIEEQLQQGKFFEQAVFRNIVNGQVGIKFIIKCIVVWIKRVGIAWGKRNE